MIFVLLCIAPMHLSGQNGISYRFINKSLRKAVEHLMDQEGLNIAFVSRQLRNETVTAVCDNCPPEKALSEMLKNTSLVWIRNGSQYMLVKGHGSIRGRLFSQASQYPVGGLQIALLESRKDRGKVIIERRISDKDGAFIFDDLKPDYYHLRIKMKGYEEYTKEDIRLLKNEHLTFEIPLIEVPLPMQEITVTPNEPSFYEIRLIEDTPLTTQTLDRRQIERMPRLGDDVYRSMDFLPGISSPDLNSAFRIRGSDTDETLIMIDGYELEEPFHFRDVFSGLFSIIDDPVVGSVDIFTGGPPVEFGDHMSGLFHIKTPRASQKNTILGITTLSLRFKTENIFAGGRGEYFIAARDGFFNDDIILTEFTESITDDTVSSSVSYSDSFSKIRYRFNNNFGMTAQYLVAQDKGSMKETSLISEGVGKIDTKGGNDNLWVTFNGDLGESMNGRLMLFSGKVTRDTNAKDSLGQRGYSILESRDYERAGLRFDGMANLFDTHLLKIGFEYEDAEANLNYDNQKIDLGSFLGGNLDPVSVQTSPDTTRWGIYLADRWRISSQVTVELGLRYDDQSHTSDSHLSPRINMAWTPGDHTSLKLAAGRYHQSQALYQLQIEDGVSDYYGAERTDHYILSYEQRLPFNIQWRTEAYLKKINNQRPRFINFLDVNNNFPEVQADRIGIQPDDGQARGLEATFTQRLTPYSGWMFNYTWSEVYDMIDGEKVFRQWDQRHAINMAFDYTVGDRWSMNLAFHYHTGWRTTDLDVIANPNEGEPFIPIKGPLYEAFLPDYHRMDLRYQRRFIELDGHTLSLFAEVTNLYNRRNIQNPGDHRLILGATDIEPRLAADEDTWVPQIANFGIHWTF